MIAIWISSWHPAMEQFPDPIWKDCYQWGFLEPRFSFSEGLVGGFGGQGEEQS